MKTNYHVQENKTNQGLTFYQKKMEVQMYCKDFLKWCKENILSIKYKGKIWTPLVLQQLRFCASIAEGMGSIPGQGPKIPRATPPPPKK